MIYIGDKKLRIPAEKKCNDEAVRKGFKDWDEWYSTEKKDLSKRVKDLDSFKFCYKVIGINL